MKRHVWILVAAAPVLFAVALAGCYQGSSPPPVAGAAPVSQSSARSAAPADETVTTVPATAVAAAKLPEGMVAVVLSVPGMS